MDENPWRRIPAEDYEAHMRAAGQSAALREFFADVYSELSPARVAVLGCTAARASGLHLVSARTRELPGGKRLVHSLFRPSRAANVNPGAE